MLAQVLFCPAGEVLGGLGDDGRLDGPAGDTTSAHGGFLFGYGVVAWVWTDLQPGDGGVGQVPGDPGSVEHEAAAAVQRVGQGCRP